LLDDIRGAYPDIPANEEDDFMKYLYRIYTANNQKFIFIIDEWDAILREFDNDTGVKDDYIDLLRCMFKDTSSEVFAAVYMTGILPIKKYKTQSALNNFIEYSMTAPANLAPYFGFTKDEVRTLSERHNMDFDELEKWYDGYCIGDEPSMFNPNSVMQAIDYRTYDSFWSRTASFMAVESYLNVDADQVRTKIIRMMNGEEVTVRVSSFRNDMKNIETSDDVLTLLAHLGYLSYNPETQSVRIPNTEVADEFENAVRFAGWKELSKAVGQSRQLLEDTINLCKDKVARAFDDYHFEASSILEFNDENSMRCAITLAYYAAKPFYKIFHELPTGKGFADMVFIPLPKSPRPAIVVELKYDKTADSAISQIKRKNYPKSLQGFSKRIVLCGINYNKETSKHEVEMEVIEGEVMEAEI
jgi:hypothetical protein